jgi:hypothetical protein
MLITWMQESKFDVLSWELFIFLSTWYISWIFLGYVLDHGLGD